MATRNTNTGGVLEAMVEPALARGGYTVTRQVDVGTTFGGGRHRVDRVASLGVTSVLISLKWQQVSGTAEQKVPFEVLRMSRALRENTDYQRAYIVLGGNGWSLRDFFVNDLLQTWMTVQEPIRVITMESFIALANDARL